MSPIAITNRRFCPPDRYFASILVDTNHDLPKKREIKEETNVFNDWQHDFEFITDIGKYFRDFIQSTLQDLKNDKWRFSAQYAQYSGYFREYDLPKVVRLEIERTHKRLTYYFRFQEGNQSYNFTSLRAGLRYNFSKIF